MSVRVRQWLRGRGQLLGKFVLVLVSLGISLAAGEFLIRWLEPAAENRPPRRPRLTPELRKLPKLKGIAVLQRPNVEGIFKGAVYRTNRHGFRGPEYDEIAPPGTFRIMLVGDSFTMGSGVWEEETYAARLAERLSEGDPSRSYEVLNLGVGGFNLRASVRRLEKIGLRYRPDLLVYGWTDNDIDGPFYRKTFRKPQPPSPSRLWDRLRSRWRAIYPVSSSYPYELDENYFRNPAAWDYFLDSLDDFARIAEQQKRCAVVFLHTNLHDLSAWRAFQRHEDAVAEAALARGLFVVRSFPAHRGRLEKQLWLHAYDSHPNKEGHEILAQSLYQGLERLPARCGLEPQA